MKSGGLGINLAELECNLFDQLVVCSLRNGLWVNGEVEGSKLFFLLSNIVLHGCWVELGFVETKNTGC